jgi:PAT family beta-lactamase induction signal transducer AmpG
MHQPTPGRNKSLALSESSSLRYFLFVVLYFSQGIPEGITLFAIPAWLAMNGKSAGEVAAYSAAVILPFSLKILLAPLMERYHYLPMGRRKPWLLFGQCGILFGLLALAAVPDPLHNLSLLTLAAIIIHVFTMFQDIATDSLVIDITPTEEQGKANSLMWGSKTIGTSIALMGGSWMINTYSFSFAVSCLSLFVLIIIFVPLLLREREGEKRLPWSRGQASPISATMVVDSWKKMFRSFRQVVALRNSLLLLSTVYITMAGIHYLITMLPLFTIQALGWTNIAYSEVFSAFNLAGGIIGMLIGGIIIQRFGILFLIRASLLLMIVMAVSIALLQPVWTNKEVITAFIAVFCVLRTLTYIGVLALAMHLCWKRISALQFTFSMTIFNAGLSTGAALMGKLHAFYDWQALFLAFGMILLTALLVSRFIRTSRHREQVDFLEKKYLQVLEAEGSLLVKTETN